MLAEHVYITAIEQGALVLDGAQGTYLQLNEIAYEILKSLGRGLKPAEIIVEIQKTYAVPESQIAADVTKCITDFTDRGWVQIS